MELQKKYYLLVAVIAVCSILFCCKEYVVSDDSVKKPPAKLNDLAKSKSPYLLQHQDNPVDWKMWGKEAFTLAKKRDVPVIISIGYSTCHWCHVMAHEVFEDKEAAELMNKWYVSVKIDREEYPEVDEIYMSALYMMQRSGGWPLNVIVTPDGKPFFGGTYFSKQQWMDILKYLHELWENDRQKVYAASDQLYNFLQQEQSYSSEEMPEKVWENLQKTLLAYYDERDPAWSNAPKFPSSQLLRLVLTLKSQTIGDKVKKQAVNILTAMQDSGLHDLVGGGFHRYSVDTIWRVPHFEKMLYDNALLAVAYFMAGEQFGRQDFTHTGERILQYLMRDTKVETNGQFAGYASAEDADDPGGEGSFYAWSPQQLEQVLGREVAQKLAKDWNIQAGEPHKNHLGHLEPVTSHIPFPRGASMKNCLATQESIEMRISWEQYYPKLLEARAKRPRPGLDNKVLTEWNGLALTAFAYGARLTGKQLYLEATQQLAKVIIERHSKQGLMRLPEIPAFVNDYGFALCGLLDAYDALGDPELVTAAQKIAEEAIALLSNEDGGFYATTKERDDLIRRSLILFDNAYPAGNSSMALGLARLWIITGEKKYQQLGAKAIQIAAPFVSQAGSSMATLLTAHLVLQRGHVTIVVTGSGEEKQKLLQACRKTAILATIVDVEKAEDFTWPVLDHRKDITETTVLVCVGNTCLAPAKTPEEIQQRLQQLNEMLTK